MSSIEKVCLWLLGCKNQSESIRVGLIDKIMSMMMSPIEPHCDKTGLRGFRPGSTQTRLYSLRKWLEA